VAQQSYAFFAVLVALTFAIMSLAACATMEHAGPQAEAIPVVQAVETPPGVKEFHGAPIGADALRGALPAE
jgi:hypothetical protein